MTTYSQLKPKSQALVDSILSMHYNLDKLPSWVNKDGFIADIRSRIIPLLVKNAFTDDYIYLNDDSGIVFPLVSKAIDPKDKELIEFLGDDWVAEWTAIEIPRKVKREIEGK